MVLKPRGVRQCRGGVAYPQEGKLNDVRFEGYAQDDHVERDTNMLNNRNRRRISNNGRDEATVTVSRVTGKDGTAVARRLHGGVFVVSRE